MSAAEDWGPMRLATWNCRQGVDAKRHAFQALAADVVVVPECNAEPGLARELGVSFLWSGDYAPKGLAVIGFNGWSVEPIDSPAELPWVLPVRVRTPGGAHAFDLLAVWTVARKDGRPGYSGQVARVFEEWAPQLAAGRTIVAGDFNCSLDGPSGGARDTNVVRLTELGLHSSYHRFSGEVHGDETAMTLRWVDRERVRRLYHCDYIVLPETLLPRVAGVTVGSFEEWVDSRLSDHCPVVVDFAVGAPALQ